MAKSAPRNDDSDREDTDAVETGDENLATVKRKPRTRAASGTARKTPAKKAAPKTATAAAKTADAKADTSKADTAKAGEDAAVETDTEKSAKTSGKREISLTFDPRTIAIAAGAAILVALLALGAWQWHSARQQVRTFNDVQSAASRFVTAMVTVSNADEAAKAKEILGPLSTGKLRETLSQQRDKHTQQTKQLDVKATSKIEHAGVEKISGDTSSALVIASIEASGAMAPAKSTNRVVMRLDMQHEGGKWLVSKADLVGSAVISPEGAGGQQGALPPGMPGGGGQGSPSGGN
ncbi:hypothetical protein [Gordonia sp. (in: high G+C Gram-positive bacteria)]|uniref:hypothetical protein n=1 Tax=Gordonia sp. (in: high G+C Gram-positive bacteria) TaxID=84139 RepID=UPI0039E24619